MISTITLTGHADSSQTLSFAYVPFAVPQNCTQLTVQYRYSAGISSDPRLQGGNTVDIGIFDTRGSDFMSTGFRGWSGSARSEFTIGLHDATPGYMPGPLQAGEWQIVLGFYKIADQGCEYTINIEITTAETVPQVDFPPRLPLATHTTRQPNPDGWYKGELHCHTWNSDGDSDPLDVVRIAEALGLDFLAITDHNVLSHQVRLAQIETPLMLIPGMEVTTYAGHWNIWGDHGWIDFRLLTEPLMQTAIQEAIARGYLVSCNHPRPYGPPWTFENVTNFHCIEVWNGPWEFYNDHCLRFWEDKLKQGKIYPAVGGSDSHFHKQEHQALLGQPTTHIYCPEDPSPAALLRALAQGHAFISDAPDGPEIYLSAGTAIMGDQIPRPADGMLTLQLRTRAADGLQLEIITADGVQQKIAIDTREQAFEVTIAVGSSPYVRVQLRDSKSLSIRALTNPIYLTTISA
jgi:hypothetical protein